MKNIILFFLGLFYVQFCHSQELPDLKAYGSDIGFNTNFVFAGFFNSNPGSTPFDLLYKRQKNNHLANRFGMKLSIQNSSKPNVTSNGLPPSASYGKYSNYFASISIGREIQKQITKRWIFYGGPDFTFNFSAYDNATYSNDILQQQNAQNRYGIRLSPFLGLRLVINDRLYIATETMLHATFTKLKNTSKSYQPTTLNYSTTEYKFNETNISITPASGIFIFYRF